MAVANVQKLAATVVVGGGTISKALASTTTGNCLVALASCGNPNSVLNSVTDSQNNIWRKGVLYKGGSAAVAVYYAPNIVGGTTPTVTATWSITNNNLGMHVYEYSGLDKRNPLDVSAVGQGVDSSVQPTATTGTNSIADSVVLAVSVGTAGSANTPTVGAGYGNFLTSGSASTDIQTSTEDKIVAARAAQTATFSNSNVNTSWDMVVAVFKASGGPLPNNYQAANADNGMSVTEKIR